VALEQEHAQFLLSALICRLTLDGATPRKLAAWRKFRYSVTVRAWTSEIIEIRAPSREGGCRLCDRSLKRRVIAYLKAQATSRRKACLSR
jgi:hypothetical protein